MTATRVYRHINAPRGRVYDALVDAAAVVRWMVPDGMTGQLLEFEAREGGRVRMSLSYDQPDAVGKSSPHTDTYHGRFVRLVRNERVEQRVEFETADPTLRGEMSLVISLADAAGGTDVFAVHDGVPRGVSAIDNETGWRQALAKLAALVEAD